MKRLAFFLVPLILASQFAVADESTAPPVPRKSAVRVTADSEKRLQWWREARFGMFIHWGLFSITGKGGWDLWSERMSIADYSKLMQQFTAPKFSGKAWAQAAKEAGMKYMVMVTKHHDGFALFDSKADSFNAMNSAAHRDFVKEYADAAREAGLHVGVYYSPLDWQFPGYFFPDLYRESAEAMREKYHRQVLELAGNYGPIDILWYDGGGSNWLSFGGLEYAGSKWQARDRSKPYTGRFDWQDDAINSRVRALHPSIVLNDRTNTPADFETREGEKKLGDFNNTVPWELCTNFAGGWGHMPGRTTPLALEHAIRLLVNTVGRDGNLLLNVGPRPDGEMEPEQVARLTEIGQWLGRYGESIYGTRGGPYLPQGQWMVSTRKSNTVYLHILSWPQDTVTLPPLSAKIIKTTVLTSGTANIKQSASSLEISVPAADHHPIDSIIALEIDKPALEIALIPAPGSDKASSNSTVIK